jgi:glycosyltransferase involved in cell wall biosynthesis
MGARARHERRDGSKVAGAREHPVKVLVPCHSLVFYGLERAVLELFDALRPDVEAFFLIHRSAARYSMPIIEQVQKRRFRFDFFHDWWDFPRINRPRSIGQFARLLGSIMVANIDALCHSPGQDAIYITTWGVAPYELMAAALFRLTGRKVILQFHDLPRKRHWWLCWTLSNVTHFVHNTPQTRDMALREQHWLKHRRNFIIPQPVIPPDQERFDRLKPFGARRILFVGQVSRHKGIDLLIEAIGRLLGTYPDIILDVVGGCDEPYRAVVEEQVQAQGLEAHVIFWGFQQNVGPFLRNAYVYVHPTPPSRFTETFGRGAMEAAACGVPAICFRSGGLEFAVVNGETGTICESEDPTELAHAIARYLNDPELQARHATNASAYYRETCAPDAVVPAWMALLSST